MKSRPLRELNADNLTTLRVVQDFLQRNQDYLDAVVSAEGTIYVVEDRENRRLERALFDLVNAELGGARTVHVSPIEFSNWHRAEALQQHSADLEFSSNRMLLHVLEEAVSDQASDIYIDILRDTCYVSMRRYGFKRPFSNLSREDGLRLATSVFSMGGSTDFQQGRPCDCAFDFEFDEHLYRVRVNSVKDTRGNSLTCRIRDPHFVLPLERCGYSSRQIDHINRLCHAPGGLIVLSGETNSGKSSSLASLILREPDTRKIIEIADPVEVEFEHCTHIEINKYGEHPEHELREVLAAVVRQNPDVLVLGEIRDRMTADAAADMAIQGKRVYATVHTQSCISVFPRLSNLGIPSDLLHHPSFLAGCVNQNLVPLTCQRCALPEAADPADARRMRELFSGAGLKYVNPEGCGHCRYGVAGQTLVAEVFPLALDRSGRAHQLISARDYGGLQQHMREQFGVLSKHQHAARKIIAGLIDPLLTENIIGEFIAADLLPHPVPALQPPAVERSA